MLLHVSTWLVTCIRLGFKQKVHAGEKLKALAGSRRTLMPALVPTQIEVVPGKRMAL